jgi:putative glutamine amidotransferase
LRLLRQPLIGICCRRDLDSDRFYLRRQYSEAIYHAGGIPALLPLLSEKPFVDGWLKKLDGVLLSGSNSDVDPHLYHVEPHPKLGFVIPERDHLDFMLLEQCFQRNIPLFAICNGIQILNVYLGGSLWQDIESQLKNPLKHSQQAPNDYLSHYVELLPGSLLCQLAGEKKKRVNSFHHQAISRVAPPLKAVAFSSDKLVEAVELKTKQRGHFVLGVQWHPEIGWEKDEFSRKIFATFVKAAAGDN